MPSLSESYAYCDRIARTRARNFYPAFRFLRKERRLALSAFYAFCTLSDDISDDSSSLTFSQKVEKLQSWRSALDNCFQGDPQAPIFIALADAIQRFALPRQPFDDLLRGIEMDLQPRRYATFADLRAYCRCVASSVGRVAVRIFGCDHPGADDYADNLGIAFQLTNILRDLKEDASRQRIYLPSSDLRQCGYSADELLRGVADERFDRLMAIQIGRAQRLYREGAELFNFLEADGRRVFGMMTATYHALLQKIARRPRLVQSRRARLSRWQKLRIAARWRLLPPRRSSLP